MDTKYLTENALISPSELEKMMFERDQKIKRITLATQAYNKLQQTGNLQLPDELRITGVPFADVLLYKSYINGFIIKNHDGRTMCSYGNMGAPASLFTNTVYRGESRDYGIFSGYSTLGRKIYSKKYNSDEGKYLHYFIQALKLYIFHGFLTSFKQYKEFPFGTPMNIAIAQHYGMDTYYLDLTDDVKVALFFASCKRKTNGAYEPIKESDLKKYGQYGILFSKQIIGTFDGIEPIGSQPFCRCNRQRGYYLNTHGIPECWNYQINENIGFTKRFFVRTPELSKRLCEEFDYGRLLFPNDGLSYFSSTIEKIQLTHDIPEKVFSLVFEQFVHELAHRRKMENITESVYSNLSNKKYICNMMREWGYRLTERFNLNLSPIDIEFIDEMNKKWSPEQFADSEGIVPSPFLILE